MEKLSNNRYSRFLCYRVYAPVFRRQNFSQDRVPETLVVFHINDSLSGDIYIDTEGYKGDTRSAFKRSLFFAFFGGTCARRRC